MWFLIIIILLAACVLLFQFISRLPGENFRGFGKIITPERTKTVHEVQTDDAFEIISGQTAPLFDTMLLLSVNDPTEVLAQWSVSPESYQQAVAEHHGEGTDTGKAVLKLNYQGRLHLKEEYPVRLGEKQKKLFINAPGCELYGELGFYTAEHAFFVLARSNTVKLPD